MHTIPELGTGVPAFLAKLWKLVEDSETDDLICWSPSGRSFFIKNQARFARELLPHYYKHNNMASFVRQLNMYGFHKIVSVEIGGLKCDRDEMEFAHQFFCKEHPYLVEHIKRKIASSKGQDPSHAPIKPELMNKMLTEVRSMRGRQENLDSKLGAMKRENEALWRELAMLRQKHHKQQQIVNKLIHFLVTLVQPSRGSGISVKRRYPLMIDDSKGCKSSKASAKSQPSPTGPVIHELESDLDSEYIVAECSGQKFSDLASMLENQQNPAIESPEHQSSSILDDENIETVQLINKSMDLQNEMQLVDAEEVEVKRKRPKGKKKRKNKVPVRILIPAMENGEEPREETHILEMSLDSPGSATMLENETYEAKPIPIATMRSSKLAAMAANMKRQTESEQEINIDDNADECVDLDDEERLNVPELVKLEDILIIPDMINERAESADSLTNEIENSRNIDNLNPGQLIDNVQTVHTVLDDDERMSDSAEEILKLTKNQEAASKSSMAGTSDSKNLSISCVNPSSMCDSQYREDMDNHLETIQTDLENLREILRGEGYSIDANTLLGLFGADDPMSFGIPVNPELDPHSNRDKEEEDPQNSGSSQNRNNGNEIMAYNPAPSLLDDFDEEIFLDPSSPSEVNAADNNPTDLYTPDPLDLDDNKSSNLDLFVSGNNTKPS